MPNILVWNINSLLPTVKNFKLQHGSIKGFFEQYDADVVCFQETKLVEEKLTREVACLDGYESFWVFSEKKLGYSGIATYVRDAWSPVSVELDRLGTIDVDLNGEGRIIISDHGSFVLLNVYVPNAGAKQEEMSSRGDLKIRFLHALKDKCDSLRAEGREVMIVGDMNIAASQQDMHPSIKYDKLYHPQEVAVFQSILKTYKDVWRLQHSNVTDAYTCWDEKTFARAVNKGVRIDYVLVSPGLLPKIKKCEIIQTPTKWSDHAAVLVTLQDVSPPGPHNPVPQSSKRMKKFDTRNQPTIASMFAKKSSKNPAAAQPTKVSSDPDTLAQTTTTEQLGRVDQSAENPVKAVSAMRAADATAEQFSAAPVEQTAIDIDKTHANNQLQDGNDLDQPAKRQRIDDSV